MRVRKIPLALMLLCTCSCSVIYDADELEVCSTLPEFPDGVCPRQVLTCLNACGDDDDMCAGDCYDSNGDMIFDEAEIDCYQCGIFTFYQCIADAGCAREVELTFCCQEALCGPAGCPTSDNPCETEGRALNECASTLSDPAVCNTAGLGCFGL